MQQQKAPNIVQQIGEFFNTLTTIAQQSVKLFTLEFKLAGHSLSKILGLGLLLAVMTMSGWFMILMVAVLLLHVWLHNGWLWPLATVIGANLILMALIVWRIRAHAKNLKFPYTRKHWFSASSEDHANANSEKSITTT